MGVPPLPAESGFTLTFGIGAVAFALVAVISWIGLRGGHRTVVAAAQAGTAEEAAAAEQREAAEATR